MFLRMLLTYISSNLNFSVKGYVGRCNNTLERCPDGDSLDLSGITAGSGATLYILNDDIYPQNLPSKSSIGSGISSLYCPNVYNVVSTPGGEDYTYDANNFSYDVNCYVFSASGSNISDIYNRSIGNYWTFPIWNALIPISIFLIVTIIIVMQFINVSAQTKFKKSQ